MANHLSSPVLGAFGVAFGLTGPASSTESIRAALADRTALTTTSGPPDVSYEIRGADELTIFRHADAEVAQIGHADGPLEAADTIGDDIHHQIAHRSEAFLLIHAGAVAWKGRAIALPGRTHAGKSSLVAALVRAGAEYLSDEFAVLDRDGLVHPYPRKLSIRDRDGRGRPVDVSELGGVSATGPRPLVLTVSTRYEEGAVWDPIPLTGSRALLPLIDNSVVARTRSEHTLSTIARLGDDITTLVGLRGEAAAATTEILSFVDRWADGRPAREA